MSHHSQRHPYRLPRSGFAWRLPLTLAFSLGLMHTASTNARGYDFEKLGLHLNTEQATWFWWAASLFVIVAFICGLARFILSERSPGYIELGPTSARLPRHSMMAARFEVPYASINDFDRQRIRGQTVLLVKSSKGTACLFAEVFALPADFDACAAELVARSGLVPGVAVRRDDRGHG